jgi:phosphatidate cytidylyltransferase
MGVSMSLVVLAVLGVDQWFAPWFPLWFVFVVLAMSAAARELTTMLAATSASPSENTVLGGVLALVIANWVPHILDDLLRQDRYPDLVVGAADPLAVLAWPLATFAAVVMATFVVQSLQFERPGRTMATIAATVLAIAYVGLLGSFTIQMRWLSGRGNGLFPLISMIATAKGADIGAYTMGRLAGRRKLWPRLSPNKTVEGAIGGLVFSTGAAILIHEVARRWLGWPAFSPVTAGFFGLIVGVFAQLGDLMESMIKRDCERKDASDVVPGFGGVLDVLDSLIFAGPVAYAFWLWMGP